MNYKRMLLIITVFIVIMFILMMTSSYAWYAFTMPSTSFDTFTTLDLLQISRETTSTISLSDGLPTETYSLNDSQDLSPYGINEFTIDLKDKSIKEQILIKISLIDVEIDEELKNESFVYQLYYNDEQIATGNFSNAKTGEEFIIHEGVPLTSANNNQFQLVIYIEENNEDQSAMMNKTFMGTVSINVVSTTKATIE